MAKPEWGTKRICQSCGARFYDMQRDPIVCPACGTTMDLSTQAKPRRSRAAPKTVAAVPEVEVEDAEVETAADDEEEDAAVEEGAGGSDDEESDSAIEDVSELGDDDMADVIDTEIEDDEGER